MMIPTAMSTTLPLTAKALNSLSTPIGYFLVTDEVGVRSVNQQTRPARNTFLQCPFLSTDKSAFSLQSATNRARNTP
jgi:hypothetical protein